MKPIIRSKFTTIAKLVVWFEYKELTDNKTIRHGKNTLTFKNSRRFQEILKKKNNQPNSARDETADYK